MKVDLKQIIQKTEDDVVSVIVPVFNVVDYLEEALDSVIHQTYKNLEIIIVDDGSFDGSEGVCDKYALLDPRVQVIHQDNQGLSVARNVGLNHMTGSFVVFLDSDDAYDEKFIEQMHNTAVFHKVDIVICKYVYQNTTGKLGLYLNATVEPKLKEGMYDNKQALRSLAQFSLTSAVWNKFYKAELWQTIRFPEGRIHEDIDTVFRVFNKCETIYVLSDILYFYRKHNNTISNVFNRKHIEDYIYATSNFIDFIYSKIGRVFESDDLYIRRHSQFERLLVYYIGYVNNFGNCDSSFLKDLRNIIILKSKTIRIKDLKFKKRLIFYLIKYFPFCVSFICKRYLGLKS